jgi:hypothetical protein
MMVALGWEEGRMVSYCFMGGRESPTLQTGNNPAFGTEL